MLDEDNKILKYNHSENSIKVPFIIYADLECLLEKISGCHYNPEKSSRTKINKHTPSGYSMLTCSSFDAKENKRRLYRGEDCMKRFCEDSKEHTTRIINYERKRIIPLTNEERKTHRWAKICH